MDLKKAFDTVKLSVLFQKLKGRVAPILIRVLIFSYIHQNCHIKWDGAKSSTFTISNGVRQGAVASPVLFNIYIDSLFDILSSSGYGCKIESLYFGSWAYADDIGLLAPSREALQQMVNIAKDFFQEHGITISTDPDIRKTKTKVLAFGVIGQPDPVMLGSTPLPYVNEWIHLGQYVNTDEDLNHDLLVKKRVLIAKFHSLQQELSVQDPRVMIKLVKTFLLHLYGCILWVFSL